MRTERKSRSKTTTSVRQSITMPEQMAAEVRRVAKERRLTMSGALISLAQRGIEAESQAREALSLSYDRFVAETESESKAKAGRELIRTVFGSDAIAEDPIR